MTILAQGTLASLDGLIVQATAAESVTWQGRRALRLENGLALLPGLETADARIEVQIGVEGPAYPGLVFRAADVANYELAYAVPHVSGQWDALQYDPVFHGSNTWQLYYGPSYQGSAQVPKGRWFRLRVDACGGRAAISIDDQPSLVVETLAHPTAAGMMGLWTYLPAHFSDLRVSTCQGLDAPPGEMPGAPEGLVTHWFAEGYGTVACEPNGVLNVNRYLPAGLSEVRVARTFELPAGGEVAFDFGFSDALTLELDGEAIWSGENTFHGFADRAARGYAELGTAGVRRALAPGAHRLGAALNVSEGFGWGLILAAHGAGLSWLPAGLG